MPFPWKKNKNRVTRISQIVADFQSPKRGGSLVVETGFPTSLIDLFVKNRSRFKKSKSKKPVRPEIPDPPPPPPSPEITPTPLPEPPTPTVPRAEAPRLSLSIGENGEGVAGAVSGRVGECCGCGSGSNMVVGVVVKMLVVAVLVATVERLTVGITVSAFALLFLEYAGKRVVSCLGPCSNASVTVPVESLSQRVSSCVWFQKLLLQLKVKKECEHETTRAELSSCSLSIDEIEVVESKSEVGVSCELDSISLIGDITWGCPQLVDDDDDDSSKGKIVAPCLCEVSECKTKVSRSGRFKSKMVKKLVPKKFRASKKEKKEKGIKLREAESGSEVSSVVEEDKVQDDVGEELEENRNKSSLLLKTELECIRDDDGVDCGITCSKVAKEEKRIGSVVVGHSSYAILLVITLVGLLVGRFPALILIMIWCFLLKIVKTLWRSQNVPVIKCYVPKS
ncbi:uncharacterized protein LOC133286337 [Gastrolobium bilobum]|uniref:uncharacterized protein LOC133286337 n=1 Tax=Gastrolobium bilobum TaxID=150636 RepID=UPI002AB07EBA|nr:uncharacterized protein LOC133286337 [Gastrolobium bilobum]